MDNRQINRRPQNGSMLEKLSGFRGKFPAHERDASNIKNPAPSAANWVADGVDHINIWENGVTELGQILIHSSPVSFKHKIFGRFATMEAFWHYIQSVERDDRVRNMSGQTLKHFCRKMTQARVQNFRAIIVDSNYQRIKQHKVIQEAIGESSLPFDCYYLNEFGIRERPSFSKWLVSGFEEIRKAIKENREPDLGYLLDVRGSEVYEFVIPEYLRKSLEQQSQPQQETAASVEEIRVQVPSLLSKVITDAELVEGSENTSTIPDTSVVVNVEQSNQYVTTSGGNGPMENLSDN